MSRSGCPPHKGRLWPILLLFILLLAMSPMPTWAADPTLPLKASDGAERAELFLAVLKRRAQRILEARRAPPPPLFSASVGTSYGYESNVNLEGDKRGDSFLEESASLSFRPTLADWAQGDLSYSLLHTHFFEFTDSNLWMNTLTGVLQLKAHPSLRLDVGGEYGILNFPNDTASSFFDQRLKVFLSWALRSWLTHKIGWTYQIREYDTRKARDLNQNTIAGANRQDTRHTASFEIQLRFPKTLFRVGADVYENTSNEQFQKFYDWQDIRLRGLLTRLFGKMWLTTLSASYERKNYALRSVPAINVAERDDLWTLGSSVMVQINKGLSLSYSLTFRYQDSNDPRLDFTDWVNQAGVSLSF